MRTPDLAAQRPNILMLHAESMDGRLMGCMGHPSMQGLTPNLDRLAARGVLFRQAYSTCPVCNPSRASLWSGKYPNVYDCWDNHEGLREGTPTFWDVLDRAGYQVSNYGKLDYAWGLHSIRDRVGSWTRTAGIERPINKMLLPWVTEEPAHQGDWSKADQLIETLQAAKNSDRPFFACMSTGLVHPAFVTSQHYYDRVDPEKIEIPPGLHDLGDDDHPVDRYMRITKNHARAMAPELVLDIRRIYFAMIAELDDVVGRVLDAVEAQGLSDSTYIVFSSDHGEMAGEHNQILKRSLYEPSIHVPLIIAGPGVRRGATVDTPVSLIDLYPTFLEMMDERYAEHATAAGWPTELDGESLLPQLTGDAPRRRDWAFAEYHGDRNLTGSYMLRRGRWKLLHHVDYAPQLFDLDADPWELTNLAPQAPDVLAELQGMLEAHFECAGIEQRARVYNKRCFRAWRNAQKADGTYAATMARIYSGFSRLCISDYLPWTDADEQLIEAWLARD